MVDVYLWWADLADAHVDLVDLLDETERNRLADLDLPADRARFLLGAALLRTAVAPSVGTAPAQVRIDRTCAECGGPHGQPVVTGGPHVSVSHSGVQVVVATCVKAKVGVDVQRVADMAGADPVGWTRQESRFKAHGARHGGEPSTTTDLEAPRPGYAAALTVAAVGAPHLHTTDRVPI
ncbi:MAG: 4'-phosphopantetheinyl transferase family protein [Ornithinimicrobium sp.]|jgi:4'-phosphopantetheinyl transferase|uniref:4'-phosphopantetheinyl transferase family protein n=1 Tax=Ornithinimicrobium sp. TaxID=1977084 RepID=UPI003D9B1FD2